jgi:hypothetical protein
MVLVLCVGLAATAAAQTERPAPVVEFSLGFAAFVDESPIGHTLVGAGARYYLTRRVSVGPEIVYMKGPGDDRDLFVTGNVTFDFVGPRPDGQARVVPYVLAGGGLFRHTNRFLFESFSSTEGAFTGGGGVRIAVGRRAYVAPEFRLGWELHSRVSVTVGVALD